MATGRGPDVVEATKHLPARLFSAAQANRLAAWLAARRGDRVSECRALERVVADDPTDFAALERLAECEAKPASENHAALLVQHKAKIKRLEASFRNLFERCQPIRDAEQLSRLARAAWPSFRGQGVSEHRGCG